MNLLLLLADFTNPFWYAIAWIIALIVLLFCLPRLLGIVYIPHTHVGVIEKIWSGKGSLMAPTPRRGRRFKDARIGKENCVNKSDSHA